MVAAQEAVVTLIAGNSGNFGNSGNSAVAASTLFVPPVIRPLGVSPGIQRNVETKSWAGNPWPPVDVAPVDPPPGETRPRWHIYDEPSGGKYLSRQWELPFAR